MRCTPPGQGQAPRFHKRKHRKAATSSSDESAWQPGIPSQSRSKQHSRRFAGYLDEPRRIGWDCSRVLGAMESVQENRDFAGFRKAPFDAMPSATSIAQTLFYAVHNNQAFYRAKESLDNATIEAVWDPHSGVTCVHPGWPLMSGRDRFSRAGTQSSTTPWSCSLPSPSPSAPLPPTASMRQQ